jgi:hypothetical protein
MTNAVHKLCFRLRLALSLDMNEREERKPVVRFYVSQPLSSTLVTVSPFTAQGSYSCTLSFPLSHRYLGTRASAVQIGAFLPQCALNIDVYNEFHTKIDEWVRKLAATASLDLAQLMCEKPGTAFKLSLRLPTAPEDYEPKGELLLHVDEMYIDSVANSCFVASSEAQSLVRTVYAQTKSLREKALHMLNNYTHASHRLFAASDASWEATRNIGFYVWKDRIGALPAMFYSAHQAPEYVEAEYFENALRLVLDSECLTADELLAYPLKHPLLASVFLQMCSMYTRYAHYSSDSTVLRKDHAQPLEVVDLEQMLLVEHTNADDCEGLAEKIRRDASYAQRLPRAACSPLLQRLIEVARHYYIAIALGAVASAEIGGDFSSLSRLKEIGAHMYVVMITRHRLIGMIRRCNRTDTVLQAPSWEEEQRIEASAEFTDMVGEGTGVLAPLPLEFPEVKRLVLPKLPRTLPGAAVTINNSGKPERVVFGDRSRVLSVSPTGHDHGAALFAGLSPNNAAFSNNSLFVTDMLQESCETATRGGARKWYTWARSMDSHFYRTVTSIYSPQLIEEGYGIGAMAVMRRDEQSPNRWRIGCTFQEFVSNSAVVALWPEVCVDRSELAAAQLLMENLAPVPPICSPKSALARWDPTLPVIGADTIARIEATLQRFNELARVHAVYVAARNHLQRDAYNTVLGGVDATLTSQDIDKMLASNSKLAAAIRRMLPAGVTALPTGGELMASMNAARERGSILPVVATYFLNYQQAQRPARIQAIEQMLDSTAVLQEDSVAESGQRDIKVYVDIVAVSYAHEQITAHVGGYRVHFATQLSYRS